MAAQLLSTVAEAETAVLKNDDAGVIFHVSYCK